MKYYLGDQVILLIFGIEEFIYDTQWSVNVSCIASKRGTLQMGPKKMGFS
jgi:hypothetical protein